MWRESAGCFGRFHFSGYGRVLSGCVFSARLAPSSTQFRPVFPGLLHDYCTECVPGARGRNAAPLRTGGPRCVGVRRLDLPWPCPVGWTGVRSRRWHVRSKIGLPRCRSGILELLWAGRRTNQRPRRRPPGSRRAHLARCPASRVSRSAWAAGFPTRNCGRFRRIFPARSTTTFTERRNGEADFRRHPLLASHISSRRRMG